jgi:hypothetical protein
MIEAIRCKNSIVPFHVIAIRQPGQVRTHAQRTSPDNVCIPQQEIFSSQGKPDILLEKRLSDVAEQEYAMWIIQGNDGRVYVTCGCDRGLNVSVVKAFAEGGKARPIKLDVYELESIWKKWA